jgi:hypothetical protein
MSFDPDFQPAVGFLRGVLDDTDQELRQIESNILERRWKTPEELAGLYGQRFQNIRSRERITRRIDTETKRRLGLPT